MGSGADGPTDCCTREQIERHFDARVQEAIASGSSAVPEISRRLRDRLLAVGPANRSVLELGCGRGRVLAALLDAGAAAATGVDLSPVSLEAARAGFDAAGVADRARLVRGDAAGVPLEPHDWVLLDRVFCCYPEVDRLLDNSIPAARRLYAFTVPPSRGWRGIVARLEGVVGSISDRLRGRPTPWFVHDVARIEARLIDVGFSRTHHEAHRLWYLAIWQREAA